ncbi:hypothetical protein DL546_003215 [Coniochaeta pulveracea]|uniref:Uncharacterized protein n=1 Tax=Coniochaeta pulveracea TaxID=177199 RepID=A0A420YEP6_9PEZI|nr:hypothetical protein DL546_003215 [Coniochaeta pulveracea]
MRLQNALSLAQVTAKLANPITLDLSSRGAARNVTYVPCTEGTTDPICQLIRQPNPDVISEIIHPNGTVETKQIRYTREQLGDIRARNNVVSVEHQPGQVLPDRSAEFVENLSKRESAPPICYTETQKWFDQQEWGYWY